MSTSKTKVSPIFAVMGFDAMTDANLVLFANGVLKGLTGNASFPNPTVPLTTFGNDITVYSNANTAALDGGKNAKTASKKAKKPVVNDLRQLAMYVESNCNDDIAIFTTSGFTARAKRTTSGPVAVPTFKSLDYGVHPGEILVSIKSVPGAKSYNVRLGPMPPAPPASAGSTPSSTPASAGATAGAAPGAAPSSWTVLNVANIKKAMPIDNLTSGTLYAFQVQALGMQGLSAWSDSSTIMCPQREALNLSAGGFGRRFFFEPVELYTATGGFGGIDEHDMAILSYALCYNALDGEDTYHPSGPGTR